MTKPSPSLRVLVVDDEPLIRWSLVETLQDSGHHVVAAADAAGAVRAVAGEKLPFDVAVLDFRLPDSSDLALLAQLRRLASAMPIVLMTAYGTPEMVEDALHVGAYCVVSKPFEMHALAALVIQAYASRGVPPLTVSANS